MKTKDIKDYLHLYLGCDVMIEAWNDHAADLGYQEKEPRLLLPSLLTLINNQDVTAKPILRHIFKITYEEKKELWRLIFSDKLNSTRLGERALDFTGRTIFKDENTHYQRPRYIMMQGLERLAIEKDCTIWADCDLHAWRHNKHELTRWLLSKGFDLFNLIESGLAIEKQPETV